MTAPLSREAAIQPQVDPEWIALAELLADRDRLLAENESKQARIDKALLLSRAIMFDIDAEPARAAIIAALTNEGKNDD